MNLLDECALSCPYCGEEIVVVVDCSVAEQSYTEDCQVCCQPIVMNLIVEHEGGFRLDVRREDE